MLLFGGYISGEPQTGIWQLKNDQWNKIGELATVDKFVKYKLNYFVERHSWICFLLRTIYLLFRIFNSKDRLERKRRA